MHTIPAFIDSHVHFLGIGRYAATLDLNGATSVEDLVAAAEKAPGDGLILGRGWNQERFRERRFPTKRDLDRAAPGRPVVMIRTCGHVLVANGAMLARAGITPETRHDGPGTMSFETGVFTEMAMSLVLDAIPAPTREDVRDSLVRANRIFLAHGITSVASDDFLTYPLPFETIVDVIRECYEKDLIQVRITEQANLGTMAELERFVAGGYVGRTCGGLRMGPLKLLADGSLGGRTALLRTDYSDDPGNRGIANYSPEDLARLVAFADQNGMDAAIHAIGDAAVERALDAIEASAKTTVRSDRRHAIIHAQLATRAQIARMKSLDVGAIVQPVFLASDLPMLDARIGARKNESYLFRTMMKQGLAVGFSTDGPVESIDPFANLRAAVMRRSGLRPDLPAFLPDECFTVFEALDCYQRTNRRYTYEEKSGDELVVSADPHRVAASELGSIEVLETRIGGRVVYRKA